MYSILFTKQAVKDANQVERAGLKAKAAVIIKTVRRNPFEESQGFEALKYDLSGTYSRRINRQHRFHYEVLPNTEKLEDENGELYEGIVKVISMWTHYHKDE
jgi:toxin YoeB